MKKSILAFGAIAFISGIALTSCNNSGKSTASTESTTSDTVRTTVDRDTVYISEIQAYKKQSDDSIAANQQSINDFNARIANDKSADREDSRKKMNELEVKNTDMKKRLDDYKAEGKAKWNEFKNSFNHDMSELGRSIKDLKNKTA
jgi:septal ring factor EnvC (AmiA/AmiB activator)